MKKFLTAFVALMLSIVAVNAGEKVIWEGSTVLSWEKEGQIPLAASEFEGLTGGSKLVCYYTQVDQQWDQAQVNYGDWTNITYSVEEGNTFTGSFVPTDIYGWFNDGILDRRTVIILTTEILESIQTKKGSYWGEVDAGVIIQGSGLTFTKISIETVEGDEPVAWGENMQFMLSAPVSEGICTYAKDCELNGTTLSQMQEVAGWTFGQENGDARASGVFAYGSDVETIWLGGKGYGAPLFGPNDEMEGQALGVVSVWSASTSYVQPVTLPAGDYVLSVPVYNAGGTGTTAKNLVGFIADNGTEYLAPNASYFEKDWELIVVNFTLEEETSGVLSVGYQAPNTGSGSNPHLFYDKVELKKVSADEKAQAELVAYLTGIVISEDLVGDGLFMIPEDAYKAYFNVAMAASSIAKTDGLTAEEYLAQIDAAAAANAAFEAVEVKQPEFNERYTFQQKASELFMGLSESGVSLVAEENASKLYFEPGENGGFYLHDEDGQYVGFAGTNNWTMSTSADMKYEWKVSYVGDNYYTLSKLSNANHHVGTNDNEIAEGAPCYADKNNSDNSYYLWMIIPVTGEEGPEDVTALIKNPAYLENGYENWNYTENAFKPRTYEAPMNLITYSGNAEFEVYQTIENVPAGLYKLTVNAFYRAGNIEDEEAVIAAGKEPQKWLKFYAEVDDDTYSKFVMNISEGASETSYNEGDHQLPNGKYVPNSAAGSRDWYIAGEYTNELLFNVFEDGTTIEIGLDKAIGLPGDYCPIGAWHLYRLGDPDDSQATPDVSYELVNLTQADYHNWTAPDATGEIVGNGYCVYEVGNKAGNVYGNPNVTANDYADLSDCGMLVVTTTDGAPRFLFNRPTDDSQDYINIPNDAAQTAKYMTSEANEDGSTSYTINVMEIVADYGFCHLNAIKGANWQEITVTEIVVARPKAEPVAYMFDGIVEQTQSHPSAGVMGTTVSDQTVTIAIEDDLANITFSGFDLPMAALGSFPEFTIEGVNVETGEDGTIHYSAEGFVVSTQMGQMTVGYAGTLEGEQADEDATPVFKLTLQNATTDEVYFGADQAAIRYNRRGLLRC